MRQGLNFTLSLFATGLALPVFSVPALAQSLGVNYISDIGGQAEVNGNRAYVGDFVRGTDELRVRSGGNVGIVCNNETRERQFPAGTYTVGDYCTESSSLRTGRRRPSREVNGTVPYVISPRETALLPGTVPTLSWNPVAGAQTYQVQVYANPTQPLWTEEVSGTSVAYDGPPLEPGVRYLIEVSSDTGLSSNALGAAVGFRLLLSSEAEPILVEAEALRAAELNEDATAIALALLYSNSPPPTGPNPLTLTQAAIDMLEDRIEAGTDNALIYVLQGDLYLSIGLTPEAQTLYRQGLALATESGQLQGQAGAWDGLALLAQARVDIETAIAQTQEALALYDVLGDSEQVAVLAERLDFLESQR
ncbi:hypothetical protein [Halomicronema sp. CCY15110]|uniref:hypothetical protein n=1 Tax=Halomicronema sp. CCY15110 TaxID=2767773 RepID=UPI001951F1AE|nr:hypothetical protein [Halomicronema sp. CCY15110]